MQIYENAKTICLSQGIGNPSLIQINSLEEQRFIEKILFDNNKIVESVWLGARLNTETHKFQWEDKTEPIKNYENWAQLKNNTDYECLEMIPDGIDKGKWINASCKKKNLVVCQKMQDWSLARLQKEFLSMKQDYELQITKLKNNPVPIGFIYVQLPSQPEPHTLWPMVEWENVTPEYAGNFLRAEGHGSAKFGEIQEYSLPKISITEADNNPDNAWQTTKVLPLNSCTGYIYTGDHALNSGRSEQSLNFCLSSEEVRPRNVAIKIWKRKK